MPDKLVGGVVEPLCDSRVKADLTHEDKEREDRVSVIRDHLKDVSAQKIHGRVKAVEVGKTGKSDQAHGETQFNTGCEKKQQYT